MQPAFNFIAELPSGYEYKIFSTDGVIKIIGAHPEREPVAYVVTSSHRLVQLRNE